MPRRRNQGPDRPFGGTPHHGFPPGSKPNRTASCIRGRSRAHQCTSISTSEVTRNKINRAVIGSNEFQKDQTKPLLIVACPGGIDDNDLKEQLSLIFNQQTSKNSPETRALVACNGEYVNISSLKEFAKNRLSRNSSLLEVLLKEPDELEANAFLAKVGIWLCLLRREGG